MTAWLRGLLGGDTKVIAQVSARSTPGRIHLLDVVGGNATEIVVAEPSDVDAATRRARAVVELRSLERQANSSGEPS